MRIVIDMQGVREKLCSRQETYTSAVELVKAFIRGNESTDEIFLAIDGSSMESCRHIREELYGLLPQKNIKAWNWYPEAFSSCSNSEAYKAFSHFHDWYLRQFNADVVWDFFVQKDWLEIERSSESDTARGMVFKFGALCDPSPFDFDSVLDYCKGHDGLYVASESLKRELVRHGNCIGSSAVSSDGRDWRKASAEIHAFLRRNVHRNNAGTAFSCIPCLQEFKSFQSIPPDADFIYKMAMSFSDSDISKGKRLYIDVTDCLDIERVTGIQRVEYSLGKKLVGMGRSSGFKDIVPIYSDTEFNKYIEADTSDFVYHRRECVQAEDIVAFHDGDVLLFLGLDMPSVFHRKAFLEQLMNRGVKIYAFLYDLIPCHYPEFFSFGRMYLHYLEAVTHLSGVVAISKFTLDDFKEWRTKYNIGVRKTFLESYVHLGSDVDEKFGLSESSTDKLEFKELGGRKTFIVVSTIEPRKMHGQILDAFDLLWKDGHDVNLVFVGKAGWLVDDLLKRIEGHPEKGRRFFWFNNMGDDALNALYGRADALIFASLIEGFGLGIVEAAAKHCRLILRDIPVFREVAGDGALYFSGEEPKDLADKVAEWISLDAEGRAPSSEGVEILSWRQCAVKFLDIIREHGKE